MKTSGSFTLIYVLGFLFTLHAALPVYVNSSFLSVFAKEETVSVLYAFASLLSIIFFFAVPRFLRKYGNGQVTFFFLILEFLSIFALATFSDPLILVIGFIGSFTAGALITFSLDIILESSSENKSTGSTRGTFLTVVNFAWVLSPIIMSLVLKDGEYKNIYFISAALLIPSAFFFFLKLRNFRDPDYQNVSLRKTFISLGERKDVRKIFVANFILQFFYAWMVIYSPIYLHEYAGFSWGDIGIIFTIMLLPFILLQRPLGRIADRLLGEKEILISGFVISALSVALIPFITGKSLIVWGGLLFITRVGASMIEVMSETYFFKKIGDRDAGLIGLFRTARPFAYIIAPILAVTLLYFIDLKYLFLVLGAIMLFGIRYGLSIKDTK